MARTRDMSVRERVEAGAAELDVVWPGWWRIVDPNKLQLASSCNCVLGQLEKFEREGKEPEYLSFYAAGLSRFERWRRTMRRRKLQNVETRFGFVGNAYLDEYVLLDRYWRNEIRKRARRKVRA